MPAGRPSSYRTEFCQLIMNEGEQGADVYMMARALGCSVETLYDWSRRFPEFSESFTRAKELSKAFVSTKLLKNLDNPAYNPKTTELYFKYCQQRTEKAAIKLPELKDAKSFSEKVHCVIAAVADGRIDAEDAKKLAEVVAMGAKVEEVDELRNLVDDLEEAINSETQS